MATAFSAAIFPSNSTDALFRAWVTFIHNSFIAFGWINTADTGQINLATVLTPTIANTKMGYKIYRMADALQATKPIFIRIDFGSGAAILGPGLWISFGASTDGAGNIVSPYYNGTVLATAIINTTGNAATGVHNSYASGNTSRIVFGLFTQVINNKIMFFFIERSKDSAGNYTGDGIIFAGSTGGIVSFSMYLKTGVAQPPADGGLNYLLPTNNPGSFGTDIGIGLHIPFAGVALYPSINVVVVRQADFATEAQFTMTLYGIVRTYQHLNSLLCRAPMVTTTEGNSRICMLYE